MLPLSSRHRKRHCLVVECGSWRLSVEGIVTFIDESDVTTATGQQDILPNTAGGIGCIGDRQVLVEVEFDVEFGMWGWGDGCK